MLFVVGGAFVHLEKLLMDSRHKSSIGFGNKVGQLTTQHTQGLASASRAGLPGTCLALPHRAVLCQLAAPASLVLLTCAAAACVLPTRSVCAVCALYVCVQVRAANMGRRGGPKIDSSILRQVEHADLINYGLIPEFVGRLPVIVSLQVGAQWWLCVLRASKGLRVCL